MNNIRAMVSLLFAAVVIIAVCCFIFSPIVVISVAVALIVGGAVYYLNASFEDRTPQQNILEATAIGVVAGVVNFGAPSLAAADMMPLLIGALVLMIALMVYMTYRWYQEGSDLGELIAFVIIQFLLRGAALTAAVGTRNVILMAIPPAVFYLTLGYALFNMAQYHTVEENNWRPLGMVAMGIAIVGAAITVGLAMRDSGIFQMSQQQTADGADDMGRSIQGFIFGTPPVESEPDSASAVMEAMSVVSPEEGTEELAQAETMAPSEEEVARADDLMALNQVYASELWYHFYNSDLDHSDQEVYQNFGPDPMLETAALDGVGDLLKEAGTSGSVKVEDILDRIDVDVLDEDFRERLRNDPALGAADMAWFDAVMGTRYIGVFYDECKGQWDAAINSAKDHFMENHDTYDQTLDAFFEYLDMSVDVSVRKDKGMTDQMYMNPFSPIAGVPDVICLESEDHEGWFLVYKFTIKGTTKKEVKYRINCGYQPTNVAETMKLTPGKNPNKKSGGGGSGGGVGGSGGGGKSGSGGGKSQQFSNPKDPTLGTKVLPNDTTGPGPNTNNGVGAQYSSVDQPTSSNHLTQQQYWQKMEDLEEINETQREGGDSNEPSYHPSTSTYGSDVHVDNNGGTGNGESKPIDNPTPKQEDAHPVDGSSITSSGGDGAWGGPPD